MEINAGGGAPLNKLTKVASDAVPTPAPTPPAPEASPSNDQDLSKLAGDAPQFGTWTKQIGDLPDYDELPELGGSSQTLRYPSDDAGDMPEVGSDLPISQATERYPSDDAGDMPEIGSISGSISQEPDIRQATMRYPSDDAGDMPEVRTELPITQATDRYPSDDGGDLPHIDDAPDTRLGRS